MRSVGHQQASEEYFDEGELSREVVVSKMEITTHHGAIEDKTQTHDEYGNRLPTYTQSAV